MEQEQLNIANYRLQIYDLLTRCFTNEPTLELVESLSNKQEFFKTLLENDSLFMVKDDLEEIIQDYYDRLFVPSSGKYVPPFESSIINRQMNKGKLEYGKLYGPQTNHVSTCYEAVGFCIKRLQLFESLRAIEIPDHIAYELAFVCYLCSEEVIALEQGKYEKAKRWNNLQHQFLTEHLGNWLEDYALLMKEQNDDFYSHVSQLAAKWVQTDIAQLLTNEY